MYKHREPLPVNSTRHFSVNSVWASSCWTVWHIERKFKGQQFSLTQSRKQP